MEVVEVKILFFAKARELVAKSEDRIRLNSSVTGSEAKDAIFEGFPELRVIKNNCVIAHNEEYVSDWDTPLRLMDGDEIAVIPPLSGG